AGPACPAGALPGWQLNRLPAELTPAARQEDLAAQGRDAVGRYGCARCHSGAFPGVAEPPPGPSLTDVAGRLKRNWLLGWLEDPSRIYPHARMPALFAPDRTGLVQLWLIAAYVSGSGEGGERADPPVAGDHRAGRQAFVSVGCIACHPVPDIPRAEQADLSRVPLRGLGDRMTAETLAAFLSHPHA